MTSHSENGSGPSVPARAARDSLLLMATVKSATGALLGKARIRNLSATGLMADCVTRLKEGNAVSMEIRGVGQVAGIITWSDGQKIGVAFDHEIDPRLARKPVGNSKA